MMATNKKIVRIVPDDEAIRNAEEEVDMQTSMQINPQASIQSSTGFLPSIASPEGSGRGIKQRLAKMDDDVNYLLATANALQENVNTLNEGGNEHQHAIQALELKLKKELDEKIDSIQQAANHRYDLQISENTRLQASVASLKSENSQLQKKLAFVLSRLDALEGEVDSEKPSMLADSFSMTSLSQVSNDQRPKTVI